MGTTSKGRTGQRRGNNEGNIYDHIEVNYEYANGVRGFESRLDEKLGKRLDKKRVHRGFKLYGAGEGTTEASR